MYGSLFYPVCVIFLVAPVVACCLVMACYSAVAWALALVVACGLAYDVACTLLEEVEDYGRSRVGRVLFCIRGVCSLPPCVTA